MLRTLAALAVIFGSGCLQAVDPDARVVSSCRGQCPLGECNEECGSTAAASCTTPQECLQAYGCSKAPASPCGEYTAERFQVGAVATACAQTPGAYCATTVGAAGARRMYAVECTDAGVQSTECAFDPCDAGSPPASCRTVCGPRYCVH